MGENMSIELAIIFSLIQEIPDMIKNLDKLMSGLRLGIIRSSRDVENINKLKKDLRDTRDKIREIGNIGFCIRDYIELSGLIAYNSQQIDLFLRSTIPSIRSLDDSESSKDILKLEHDKCRKHFIQIDTFLADRHKKNIDKEDYGSISAYLEQIHDNLLKCDTLIENMNYRGLEENLKDSSLKMTKISGLCNNSIRNISTPLIYIQNNLPP